MLSKSPVYRVWARGGLGNQLSSLSAAFVAASESGIRGSTVVVDSSVVEGSRDPQRRLQINRFRLSDARGQVRIEVRPGNSCHRRLRSGIRRVLFSRSLALTSFKVHCDGSSFEARRLGRRFFIDGHHEDTQVAQRALDLGLGTPFELVAPTQQYSHFMNLIHYETVAVHIRLGDFREGRGGLPAWSRLLSRCVCGAWHQTHRNPRSPIFGRTRRGIRSS
jgi:hypothetical protein